MPDRRHRWLALYGGATTPPAPPLPYAELITSFNPALWYRFNEQNGTPVNAGSGTTANPSVTAGLQGKVGLLGAGEALRGSSTGDGLFQVDYTRADGAFGLALLLNRFSTAAQRFVHLDSTGASYVGFSFGTLTVVLAHSTTNLTYTFSVSTPWPIDTWAWLFINYKADRTLELLLDSGGTVSAITPASATAGVGTTGGTLFAAGNLTGQGMRASLDEAILRVGAIWTLADAQAVTTASRTPLADTYANAVAAANPPVWLRFRESTSEPFNYGSSTVATTTVNVTKAQTGALGASEAYASLVTSPTISYTLAQPTGEHDLALLIFPDYNQPATGTVAMVGWGSGASYIRMTVLDGENKLEISYAHSTSAATWTGTAGNFKRGEWQWLFVRYNTSRTFDVRAGRDGALVELTATSQTPGVGTLALGSGVEYLGVRAYIDEIIQTASGVVLSDTLRLRLIADAVPSGSAGLTYDQAMTAAAWDGWLRFRQADAVTPIPNYGSNAAWTEFTGVNVTHAAGMRQAGEAFVFPVSDVFATPTSLITPAGYSGGITIAVLLKIDGAQVPSDTIFSEENGRIGLGLTSTTRKPIFSMVFNNGGFPSTASFSSDDALPTNWTWLFITVSAAPTRTIRMWQGYAGNLVELLEDTSQAGTGVTFPSSSVAIGFGFNVFEYFDGWIDEFAFKLGILTEAQMRQIVGSSYA